METLSAARAAYWSKQVKRYISKGKPFPERFCKALSRQTFISKVVTPEGIAQYIPDRSPLATAALNEMYSLFPKDLDVILSIKEPIIINNAPAARKQRTPKKVIKRPKFKIKFREPKYAKPVAKLIEQGRPIMLVGPAGSGKTQLFYNIARKAKKTLYRVNFDGGMTPDAFMGGMRLRTTNNPDGTFTQETYFQEGPVVKAAQEGAWLLLDELDKAQPEYAAALHAMTEDIYNPIVLNDDGGRIVTPHPNFRILATANTLGNMEESSLGYYGSSPMNAAFKDRFAIMQVDYPPDETSIIDDILDNRDMAEKLVKIAKLARQAMLEGLLTGTPFSTRRLIAWASTYKYLEDFEYATELEVLGRYAEAPRSLVESFISNVFGNKWQSFTDTVESQKSAS
jgi:cobaltochelatase CobS